MSAPTWVIWLVDENDRMVAAVWTGEAGQLQDGYAMWSILQAKGPVNPKHKYTRNW